MTHMICASVKREVRFICRSVVRLIDISVSNAMGCFFGCFRVRDHRTARPPPPSPFSSNPPPSVPSSNRLSSLFLSEEKENEDSPYKDKESPCLESPRITTELRDEAKFLKACGTLPETPVEIRKASERLKDAHSLGKDSESLKFHSWLPATSIKKLQLDMQIDQPLTPFKPFEQNCERGSVSSERTPSSCISNVQNSGMMLITSNEDSNAGNLKNVVKVHANEGVTTSVTNEPGRNKFVRFECDFDACSSKGSSSENGHPISRKFDSPADLSVSRPSPRPTPLRLSDEMQTPGTVFPASVQPSANGKTRIRSQYVYSVMNPVENASQWKVLKEVDSCSHQSSAELGETLEQSEAESEVGIKKTSSVKDLKVEASLSSWIRPPESTHDEGNPSLGTASKNFRFGRTPGDRPIIGMVAAHWNEHETSQISPKWWDGKGIPNSTNKYKEDQKVSWHATPFEERLEKALSEESFVSQRKHSNGMPIDFNECDESDTALSKLRSSTQSKSVVSF